MFCSDFFFKANNNKYKIFIGATQGMWIINCQKHKYLETFVFWINFLTFCFCGYFFSARLRLVVGQEGLNRTKMMRQKIWRSSWSRQWKKCRQLRDILPLKQADDLSGDTVWQQSPVKPLAWGRYIQN